MTYDQEGTRSYFDEFADREWDRLEKSLQARVNYSVHRRLLDAYIRRGMEVVDVGCGPGRFAIDIAQSGARVTLVDLSQVQLELARRRLAERGLTEQVRGFHCLDVLELNSLGEAAYDAVICFGGVVSYTTVRHLDALRQLARVARPGAYIFVSVMSLFGALRLLGPLDMAGFLETPEEHLDWKAVLAGAGVVYTNPGSREFHRPLALFTAEGLRDAVRSVGLHIETTASSNPLVPQFLAIPRICASQRASAALIELEAALCERAGLVDAGGHLIIVARKQD